MRTAPRAIPTCFLALLALLVGLAACHDSSGSSSSTTTTPTRAPLGGHLPGLTQDQRDAFEAGRIQFGRRFQPSEGLGPFYNATSCEACHSTPTAGGSSQLYRNFYLAAWDLAGDQQAFPELPSIVVPSYGAGMHSNGVFRLAGARFSIPVMYLGLFQVLTAQRNALPLFGIGLFEFITDATILSNADPDDADGDGISGRFNMDEVGVGRFGAKAQSNNIELFTRPPLMNQMGITSNPFRGDNATVSMSLRAVQVGGGPNVDLTDDDGVSDPEIRRRDLGDLIAFTSFLAPPEPLAFNAAALRGEALFDQLGCAACHIPELLSSRGPVRAYTDLLLHDMGPDLADGLHFGTPQTSAISPPHTGSEWRTQPLWGVALHRPFLHDGRAPTLEDAILLHAGEGEASRDAFDALSDAEKDDLIEFLEHL